jgi:hypothetical protein
LKVSRDVESMITVMFAILCKHRSGCKQKLRHRPQLRASNSSERITAWVESGRSREDLTTRRRGRRTGCEAGVSSHPCATAMTRICRHHKKVSRRLTYQSVDMREVSLWWKGGECAAMRRHAQRMLSTFRKLAAAQPPATKRANSRWLLAGLYTR